MFLCLEHRNICNDFFSNKDSVNYKKKTNFHCLTVGKHLKILILKLYTHLEIEYGKQGDICYKADVGFDVKT